MLVLKAWAEGPMGLMHAFESLLASLSHTISYVRILAMKLIEDVFYHLFLGVLVFFAAWGTLAGNPHRIRYLLGFDDRTHPYP